MLGAFRSSNWHQVLSPLCYNQKMKVNTPILLTISLVSGLALSALSIIYINSNVVTILDDDTNYTTHVVKHGFPIPYFTITEGTACNGGTETSLRGIYESGTCPRDLDRSGFSLVLNTFVWSALVCLPLLLLKNRKAKLNK